MTSRELLRAVEGQGITLQPTAAGRLTYRAKKGVLTMVLQGVLKTCRTPLWALLTTGEDTDLPKHVSLPATDYSQFRTWQTGKAPATGAQVAKALEAPKYHDSPSAPQTSLGRPCPKKGCKPTTTFKDGRPASRYFRPSGLCVACWERLDKRTTAHEDTPSSTLGPLFERYEE